MNAETNKNKIMKCGHRATACIGEGDKKLYCCPICVGLTADALTPCEVQDLKGRKAKCTYCDCIKDSDLDLPFFELHLKCEHDSFYCGCRGWD